MRFHKELLILVSCCVFVLSPVKGEQACCDDSNPSATWQQYLDSKDNGTVAPLIDFSYAGYQRGEAPIPRVNARLFKIGDFGAVPDDGKSDKVAIQQAFDAAAKVSGEGGAIVLFPAGRFLINESGDDQPSVLHIRSSHIVVRGAGSDAGGTELFMTQSLEAKDPSKMWTTPYLIQVAAPYHKSKQLALISKPSEIDSLTIHVDQTHLIAPGDWVAVRRRDTSKLAIQEALAPYQPDPAWTNITEGGVHVREYHQVKSVTSNSLTFYEPVHYAIQPDAGWTVESYQPIEQVGFEDLALVGNWRERFVHHQSAVHDGGWSMLRYSKVVNGWVRRCRFTDLNNSLTLDHCAQVTASELILDGNKGHSAVGFRNSSHCLGAVINDSAGHHHASGVGGMSSANVFWRIRYRSDTSFEAHASQPRHTLFDQVSGGFVDGRWGGAASNQPNHLEGLVFWNYHNTSKDRPEPYEFVKTNKTYGKIIMPQVIGFHGGRVDFVKSQVKTLESLGSPVLPASLYEAQLRYRLGQLPPWVTELDPL